MAASPNAATPTPAGCSSKPPWHFLDHPGPLGAFFRKIAHKKNRNVAVVATARKLVIIAWHMLKSNQPYRYALPKPTETKLARLRIAVTGEKRKGGFPRGQKAKPLLAPGIGSRQIKALADVYAAEHLPPLAPPPPGEQAALARSGPDVEAFTRDLLVARRIPRKPAPK